MCNRNSSVTKFPLDETFIWQDLPMVITLHLKFRWGLSYNSYVLCYKVKLYLIEINVHLPQIQQ